MRAEQRIFADLQRGSGLIVLFRRRERDTINLQKPFAVPAPVFAPQISGSSVGDELYPGFFRGIRESEPQAFVSATVKLYRGPTKPRNTRTELEALGTQL